MWEEKNSFIDNLMRKQFCLAYWLKEWEFEELSESEQAQAKRDYLKYIANPWEWHKYPQYVDMFWNEIDVEERAKLFEDASYKSVARDIVNWYLVSTVWLWINHWLSTDPKYFETMIFKTEEDWSFNPTDLYQNRYTTRSEAEEKHKELVAYMKETNLLPNYTV